MIPLANEQQESYENGKICYICKKRLNINTLVIKIIYRKNKNYCHYTGKYRGAAHSICNLE